MTLIAPGPRNPTRARAKMKTGNACTMSAARMIPSLA